MSKEAGKIIIVSPIGEIDMDVCETVAGAVESVFSFPTKITPLIDDIEFALNVERRQYHSTPILEKLTEKIPENAIKAIGITKKDLFIPILTHVYGEAQLGGTSCIVSTFRLKEEISEIGTGVYENRLKKESIHELGHTFNLLHCRDSSCIMHYCRSIHDVDKKRDKLCRYCTIMLQDDIKRLRKKGRV